MHFKPVFALIALAAIGTTSPMPAPVSGPAYRISLKIFDGGRLRAAPNLVTSSSEPATFLNRSGSESLEVIAFPKPGGQFHVNASLLQWTPRGMIGSDQAYVLDSDGKPTNILLDKTHARTGRPGKLRVEVTISTAG